MLRSELVLEATVRSGADVWEHASYFRSKTRSIDPSNASTVTMPSVHSQSVAPDITGGVAVLAHCNHVTITTSNVGHGP